MMRTLIFWAGVWLVVSFIVAIILGKAIKLLNRTEED